jgi:glutamate/tyrosine decarboxylase-like PLP-dependent enzyme
LADIRQSGALLDLIAQGLTALDEWRGQWPMVATDDATRVDSARAEAVIAELMERLRDNYPFGDPAYAGQMLKPPHEIASAAYFLTQQINPTNHALDGGPATAALERETIAALAAMFGFELAASLGHLTSSGTIANLEALWVARQLHPDKSIAYSADAHYTHSRMCEVLGVRGIPIAVDDHGRLDLSDLEAKLSSENIGTVVATLGTTSLGAVDPLHEILPLTQAVGARIHVDSAYGGFFRLLADQTSPLPASAAAAFRAIQSADSVVVDPHKHGLQPYGCGCVLFRDASVGRFYKHDSPYTYFTSDELHLGEISLECSRAGAAAAALWATLQCFPLESHAGIGVILQKTRAAAVAWADLIRASDRLRLIVEPELDIVNFCPMPAGEDRRVSAISGLTQTVFEAGMADRTEPFFLAKLNLKPSQLVSHADLVWDAPTLTCLRSVLMKPEHLALVPTLHRRVLAAAEAPAPS